jgi:galactose mutarotase-like enzyme
MTTTISNEKISATIASLGAELIRLEKDNQNYIWTVDESYWNKTSPVLFPIVGRLKNDTYSVNGTEYSLPRHGFARNIDFKIVEQSDDTVTFMMESDENTLAIYPFSFRLLLSYKVIEAFLTVSYTVINLSDVEMPFSIGAHPAFAITSVFSDYALVFEKNEPLISYELHNEIFNSDTKKIPIKEGVLPLDYELFQKDALVFKNLASNSISLLKHNKPILSVVFEGFDYLGIWTKPNAPFLCIEPWCGLADHESHDGNLYKKEGIEILQSKQSLSRTIKIKIE